MDKDAKIYVAGHTGMIGSSITYMLKKKGYSNLLLKSHQDLNLLNQQAVKLFYDKYKPEYVFICAAKVGGIHANNIYRAHFIYENLQIQNNLIHFAYESGVKKLLFMGSSCIYPPGCIQPMKEEYLLTGPLEKTNEPYAVAKIAGIKMCESYFLQFGTQFFSIMPTNSYGPNDNYDLETSHVFPALIRKFHEAKIKGLDQVVIWGTGSALREFIYVEDIANAAIFIMDLDFDKLYGMGINHLNVGTGIETSIKDLAELIAKKLGCTARIEYDLSKPDGTLRKIMDSSRIHDLGWKAIISLEKGIELAYDSFKSEHESK